MDYGNYDSEYNDENNISNIENPKFNPKNHYESFEFDFTEMDSRIQKSNPKDIESNKHELLCSFIKTPTMYNILRNEPIARFKSKLSKTVIETTDDFLKDILSPEDGIKGKGNAVGWFSSLNLIDLTKYKSSQALLDDLHVGGIADVSFDFNKKGVVKNDRNGTKIHPATSFRALIFGEVEGLINTILEPLQLDEKGEYICEPVGSKPKPICGVPSHPGMLLKPRIFYYDVNLAKTATHNKPYYDPTSKLWYQYNLGSLPPILSNSKKIGIYWEPVESCIFKTYVKEAKKVTARDDKNKVPEKQHEKNLEDCFIKIRESNYAHFMCSNYSEPGEPMHGYLLLPR